MLFSQFLNSSLLVSINGREGLCIVDSVYKMVKSNQTGRIKAFGLKVNGKDIGADDHWSPKVLCGKIGPKAKGKSSKFLFRIVSGTN